MLDHSIIDAFHLVLCALQSTCEAVRQLNKDNEEVIVADGRQKNSKALLHFTKHEANGRRATVKHREEGRLLFPPTH